MATIKQRITDAAMSAKFQGQSPSSVCLYLVHFAASEGRANATAICESLQEFLETILEIGSFKERDVAAFLLKNVTQALKEMGDCKGGNLVDIAKKHL